MGKNLSNPGRLETFSDAVIAVIITIMVLELKPPHSPDVHALVPLIPTMLVYTLSFIFIGIYWNNHHMVFRLTKRIDVRVLWANLHLLFWLSLIPFVTAWVGDYWNSVWPAVFYGVVALCTGLAHFILVKTITALNNDTRSKKTVGNTSKGNISEIIYVIAIIVAFINPLFSYVLYALVALLWLSPEHHLRRIKKDNL